MLRWRRGEDIGEVSREVPVAPPELEGWWRVFLDGGPAGPEGQERDGKGADADPGRSWGAVVRPCCGCDKSWRLRSSLSP